jgi:hypothetical protein
MWEISLDSVLQLQDWKVPNFGLCVLSATLSKGSTCPWRGHGTQKIGPLSLRKFFLYQCPLSFLHSCLQVPSLRAPITVLKTVPITGTYKGQRLGSWTLLPPHIPWSMGSTSSTLLPCRGRDKRLKGRECTSIHWSKGECSVLTDGVTVLPEQRAVGVTGNSSSCCNRCLRRGTGWEAGRGQARNVTDPQVAT